MAINDGIGGGLGGLHEGVDFVTGGAVSGDIDFDFESFERDAVDRFLIALGAAGQIATKECELGFFASLGCGRKNVINIRPGASGEAVEELLAAFISQIVDGDEEIAIGGCSEIDHRVQAVACALPAEFTAIGGEECEHCVAARIDALGFAVD